MIVGEILGQNNLFTTSTFTRYGIWFSGIIISQAIYRCKVIDNRIFKKIGQKSYPIYLFHYLVINILSEVIVIENQNIFIIIKFIMTVTLTYLVALVLIKYVDKPLKKLINNICLK